MITEAKFVKGDVALRQLEFLDCQQYYVDWLNDPEVNQYLETRWSVQCLESIREFVRSIRESSHSYIFAVLYKNKHVGNIKIGPIHPIYCYGDISIFIGDKQSWGKGAAASAIELITRFCFEVLKINKVKAGVVEGNRASQRALEKVGFKLEATYKREIFVASTSCYCDRYVYGLLRDEWI